MNKRFLLQLAYEAVEELQQELCEFAPGRNEAERVFLETSPAVLDLLLQLIKEEQ